MNQHHVYADKVVGTITSGGAVSNRPQDLAARQLMDEKGLGHLRPFDVQKIEGAPCWYFYYELPEGVLELEVNWDGCEWQTCFYTFNVAQ